MLEAMRGQMYVGEEPVEEEEEEGDDPGEFTPSRLMGCDRRAGLETRHDTWLDVDAAFPMFRGNMVHALMEQEGSRYPGALGGLREMRFSTAVETKYGTKRFSGKPDLIVVKRAEPLLLMDSQTDQPVILYRCKIVDYKSTSEIKHELVAAHRTHQMQVNMYAWLVERELARHLNQPVLVKVDELEIVYVDMRKTRRFTSAGPLTARGKRLNRSAPYQYETLDLAPIKLLPMGQVEAWIRTHIEARIRATTEVLPPPLSGEAAWVCRTCPVSEICFSLPDAKEVA